MSPRRRAIRAVLDVARECDAKGGFVAIEGHRRGGYWIGAQGERQVYGYTLENAKAVQRILAQAAGWKPRSHGIDQYCTIQKAEGELAHAIVEPTDYGADRSAGRMRAKRAKAPEGYCKTCTREPVKEGRKYCFLCLGRAAERNARAREDRKAS